MEAKIFVGRKLRSLRDLHGLTQSKMAAALDISPTYLNLLEHNNRHLTLNVLIKLNAIFDVDMKIFATDETPELQTRLANVFNDPVTATTPISQRDLGDLNKDFPSISEAIINLYDSYNRLHEKFINVKATSSPQSNVDPFNSIAQTFDAHQTSFAALEFSAHQFTEDLYKLGKVLPIPFSKNAVSGIVNFFPLISHFVDNQLGLRVRIIPPTVMGSALRRYDPHRREILLNKKLKQNALQFHLLVQTALIFKRDLLDEMVEKVSDKASADQPMLSTAFAGYFSGVVMFPDPPFIMSKSVRSESVSMRNSMNSLYMSAAFAALGNEFVNA
tara:strand:+ start:1147 stop:2136 length:990 start_codon:yes stop_codon:yes gene_type:complete